MKNNKTLSFVLLCGIYFVYLAILGVMTPYLPQYLDYKGFDATQIGILVGITFIIKCFGVFVCPIADKHGNHLQIARWFAFIATALFVSMFFNTQNFYWVGASLFLYGIIWASILGLQETITHEVLGDKSNLYSYIRLWGTLGFLFGANYLGGYVYTLGFDSLIPILLGLNVILFAIYCLFRQQPKPANAIEARKTPSQFNRAELLEILKQPVIIAFFISGFLTQFSLGPLYTIHNQYLDLHGFTGEQIRMTWSYAMIAEICILSMMPRIWKSGISALFVFKLSILVTCIRWLLVALFPDNVTVINLTMCLHAFSYGTFHIASMAIILSYFKSTYNSTGQSLNLCIMFGLGNTLGCFAAGYWQIVGPQNTFMYAAILCGVGFVVSTIWMRD